MAPLAQTLALLAMTAVATAAIKVVPLDMAKNSFDDQYLKCSRNLTENLLELQVSDFCKDEEFFNNWKNATAEWRRRGSNTFSLTKDEAVALMAYTMNLTRLYKKFNDATSKAGESPRKYKNEFQFKSLHFLLTRALQKLNPDRACQNVYRGVKGVKFDTEPGKEVRFGYFTSTSLSETVAQGYGPDTMFRVLTCYSTDIQKFSYDPSQKEVLIPPFEKFRVVEVTEAENTKSIRLRSNGTFSNYDCEWLKGGSHSSNSAHLPTNSPHLGGLLLATVAMAVVTRTL